MLIVNLMKMWMALGDKSDRSVEAVCLFCLLGLDLTLALARLGAI
jgi:hypothetical protein